MQFAQQRTQAGFTATVGNDEADTPTGRDLQTRVFTRVTLRNWITAHCLQNKGRHDSRNEDNVREALHTWRAKYGNALIF